MDQVIRFEVTIKTSSPGIVSQNLLRIAIERVLERTITEGYTIAVKKSDDTCVFCGIAICYACGECNPDNSNVEHKSSCSTLIAKEIAP